MRDVTIPLDVQLSHPVTGKALVIDGSDAPWSMFRFLVTFVLPDPGMGKGYKADRARSKVEALFRDATPGTTVGVEDADWELMRAAVESPAAGGAPQITAQCLSFQAAIMEAPERKG